jgi:hypothetical protein
MRPRRDRRPLCRATRAAALVWLAAAGGCATTRPSGPTVDDALSARPEALIQLRNDGCDDGSCGVYGVSIYVDGTVVYGGGANVAILGPRRSKLTPDTVEKLVAQIEKMDFLDVPEHCCDCPGASADAKAPQLVIDYRPGGVEKEIVVDTRCPALPDAIRGLAHEISAASGADALIAPAPTRLAGGPLDPSR